MGRVYKQPGKRSWYIDYVDARGERCRESARTTDKTTANQLLATREKHVAQIHAGVRDESLDKAAEFAKQPIDAWITAFVQSLEIENGRDNRHVADSNSKILAFVNASNITNGLQLTAEKLLAYTSARQSEEKISQRTVQSYIVCLRQFSKWCVSTGRLLRDPFQSIRAPRGAKRVYVRRALDRLEWQLLKQSTLSGPIRRGMTGPERVLLYELALVTGLRSKEIESLKRSSVIFSDMPYSSYLSLPGGTTKNKKPAEQFLTPSLTASLRQRLATMHPNARIFRLGDRARLATMLRDDCEAARRDWIAAAKTVDERNTRENSETLLSPTASGDVLDFHALRHSCGAWLAMAGIHPKQIQKVMRHSSITLTLDTYGHLFPEQQTDAVQALAKAIG